MTLDELRESLDRLIGEAPEVAPSIQHFDEDRGYGRVTDEALDRSRLIRWQVEVSAQLKSLTTLDNRIFADLQARYEAAITENRQHHSRSILVHRTRDILFAARELLASPFLRQSEGTAREPLSNVDAHVTRGYGFIAMSMDPEDHALVDVLDAVKTAARACGVEAERIDEPQSNERITDRILESIRRAEYVFVELTGSRPNVFFEAGYAHGLGKLPIYFARHGTSLEFDLKDYPIIFFRNLAELKALLTRRIQGLQASSKSE